MNDLDRVGLSSLAAELGASVRLNEPMSRHTAMRVGGPADMLVVCEAVDDLISAVNLAREYGVPWRVLGGGCNVLVSDSGLRGLVLVNKAAAVEVEGYSIRAEAGGPLMALAREAVGQGLAGMTWATGLPGSVGGAIVGNAGAFEGDIAGALTSAMVLRSDGVVVECPADWFEFGYRSSRLKRGATAEGHVVLSGRFDLEPGDSQELTTRAAEIQDWRQTRHPAGATMGSTFKNPPGSHAGYLIEQAGLRGYRIGGAEISHLHGNFIMNTGGATAVDVLSLIAFARETVHHRFGVDLELEIEVLGECVGVSPAVLTDVEVTG
ncbi:MAG: UDP-N-acetylmuramate dehydrogenase [Chloroflexi bacterium]|nr:UDP-N-acetylmuramate dehydrogenase [Chloroflexota bacterium]